MGAHLLSRWAAFSYDEHKGVQRVFVDGALDRMGIAMPS